MKMLTVKKRMALLLAILIALSFSLVSCVQNDGGTADTSEQGTEGGAEEEKTTYSEGLTYALNEDGKSYTVTGSGTCPDTEIVIPSLYQNRPVTQIGDDAFYQCKDIRSITLSERITTIGVRAFGECTSLTHIVLPEGVTDIRANAFFRCVNLMSITLPSSIRNIEETAFSECRRMVEIINHSEFEVQNVARYDVEIHNGTSKLTEQDGYFFYSSEKGNYLVGCVKARAELILPETLNGASYEINRNAFYRLGNIVSVRIPSGVTAIGDGAFGECSNILEVINHSALEIVKGGSDHGGVASNALFVHDGDTKLLKQEDFLFLQEEDAVYLVGYAGTDTTLRFPSSYNGSTYRIRAEAFYHCNDIERVEISDGVTAIGESAFSGCEDLKEAVIGGPITEIGNFAFGYCSGLSDVKLQNGITTIGAAMFSQCYALQNVEIAETVTEIGNEAFRSCEALKSVEIPNGVTGIGMMAFEGCIRLMRVTVPFSLTRIDQNAFGGCLNLVEVINHSDLQLAPGGMNCGFIAMYALDVHREESRILNENGFLFFTSHQDHYLLGYVGSETDLVLPDKYTDGYEIYQYAFYNCTQLKSVKISDCVTNIGTSAFRGCENLETVELPNGITSIEADTFTNCSRLTEIVLPDSITSIGRSAFSSCKRLVSVDFPSNVTVIGDDAFSYCTSLAEIKLPNTVTYIGTSAFVECAVNTILYKGTMEEWAAIDKQQDWIYPWNGSVVCSDGTVD